MAQAEQEIAEKEYKEMGDGPDPEELAKAETRLKAAHARVEAAEAALHDTTIMAAFSGKVLDIDMKVGEQVSPGQVVLVLADTSQWVVETKNLTEIDVVDIKEGQKVLVQLDAIPDLELTGQVGEYQRILRREIGRYHL